jgi:F-box and WD-40 domain protein 1/11
MNYEYSGSSFLARPPMPEQRPHTVHSSTVPFNACHIKEEEEEHMQGLDFGSAISRRASLSRDDTAADMSMPFSKTHAPSMSWSDSLAQEQSSNLRDPHFPTEESRLQFWKSQRSRRRQFVRPIGHSSASSVSSLGRTSSFLSQVSGASSTSSAASSSSTIALNIPPTEESPRKSSLSRRLSRSVKKMHDFGTNITSGPALRIRKSSSAEIVKPTFVDGLIPSLASPTKRNGKHGDDRPKKSRTAALSGAERKDTPAPPFGQAPRSAPWPLGGESARQSAALFNTATFDFETATEEKLDDVFTQRARLGSISSAADSGADLSTYARYDSPQRDCDGDVEMAAAVHPPQDGKVDFVSGSLPEELSLAVFKLLDGPTLAAASQVSRSWNNIIKDDSVWRVAFFRRWGREVHTSPAPIQVGGPGTGLPNTPKQEWKKMYRARTLLERQWRMGPERSGKATYLSGHTDSVYCVQFDEEKIITGSRDRTIRVWDINTMQCIKVIGGPNVKPVPGPKPLRTVDYPSFHSAVASVNGTVYGNSIYHVPEYWHDASILCLQYDENILVTGSSDSDLIVWDIKTYEPIRRLKAHTGGVLDVALDAKHIVSCSKDSKIYVWDRETFEIKGTLEGHRGPVNAVQLRGKFLVSASGDGIARLWNIEENKLVKEFTAKERGLAAVEFSEDMKYVLAGGNDHITYKFETETGREVAQFTGHTQLVRSLWLDSANNRVVSGSYDLDLRVYDFETGNEIWRAEDWTTSWMLAAKSDYRRIVATSQDGRVLVIDFGLRKELDNDGTPIEGVDLLREIPLENTNAIIFRNPFEESY